MTQEKFVAWLEKHHGYTTTITDWLMDGERLHELVPSPTDKTSDQFSILAAVTHCMNMKIIHFTLIKWDLFCLFI